VSVAFSDLELKTIDRTVGALCRRLSPPRLAEELRVVYEVNGHSVLIFEERPPWRGTGEWTRLGVAKFRYVRSRGLWSLYWMRRDLRWHLYEPEAATADLAALVAVVDEDTHGAFFGRAVSMTFHPCRSSAHRVDIAP
jgi:hypothetical protein